MIHILTNISPSFLKFTNLLMTVEVYLLHFKTICEVWHTGLLHKLKQSGISGKLFDIINEFLDFGKQRIALNGQCSSWTIIESGVPMKDQ